MRLQNIFRITRTRANRNVDPKNTLGDKFLIFPVYGVQEVGPPEVSPWEVVYLERNGNPVHTRRLLGTVKVADVRSIDGFLDIPFAAEIGLDIPSLAEEKEEVQETIPSYDKLPGFSLSRDRQMVFAYDLSGKVFAELANGGIWNVIRLSDSTYAGVNYGSILAQADFNEEKAEYEFYPLTLSNNAPDGEITRWEQPLVFDSERVYMVSNRADVPPLDVDG